MNTMKATTMGVLWVLLFHSVPTHANQLPVNEKLQHYIKARLQEFDQIPQERKNQLKKLASFVEERLRAGSAPSLIFICTHNSRRSHLAQIWFGTAAAWYGVDKVRTYSGGIQCTAFNPRAVAALRRAGFEIQKTTDDDNPIYLVRYRPDSLPMTCFSKVYNQAPNPKKDFCAVMTCSQADNSCPVVEGAILRVAIPYVDPKAFDNTDKETQAYDERCRQIAREQLYVFSQVRKDR